MLLTFSEDFYDYSFFRRNDSRSKFLASGDARSLILNVLRLFMNIIQARFMKFL